MGYPTKVQLIHRKNAPDQYYINFPTAIAEAMQFEKGEGVHGSEKIMRRRDI